MPARYISINYVIIFGLYIKFRRYMYMSDFKMINIWSQGHQAPISCKSLIRNKVKEPDLDMTFGMSGLGYDRGIHIFCEPLLYNYGPITVYKEIFPAF